jgi:S-layer protein
VATALAAAIDADAAYTATAVGGKLTITAEVPGTPFTVGTASVTTNVGAASTVTSSSLTGTINVGQTTSATGAVVVNANIQSDGTGAHVTGGAINVKGGSSITVNANLASAAKDNDSDFDGAIGTITAVGDGKTTSVSLNQVKSATTVTKAAVATVKETSVVTFGAMKSGEELTINGLTFTASKDLTAEQVAAAFSNLSVDDTQSENGPVANGYYSGSFLTAGSEWTSGAASGKTVTFTAKDENETNLTFGGDATTNDGGARIPTQVVTAGTLGTASDRSGNVTTYGAVRVDDAATAAITTVSVNGYLSADLGLTGSDLNALTTLSLANSAGAATVRSDETTLGLTVNNVRHGVDLGASYTTLNVTASGANSTFGLTAGGVKDLTVAGDKTVTVTGAAAMGALETVTVTGSAGLSLGANSVAKSVTTTGTTGTVTATLAATATYTGGAGVDNVSLLATSITKDVVLGAGNDTLNLVAGTTASSVVLDGGAGTDTLAMASADAATLSAAAVFETKFTGFERLQLNLATDGARTVDMSNLNDINYVIAAGGAGVSDLTLNKFVNGGTLELTGGATTTTVSLADATGTADVLNIVTKVVSTDVNFNTVAAAGVETINITATDTTLDDNGDGANDPVETATLTLSDAALKSLVIGGNANVDLSLNANVVALNSVDARGLTGSLTIATNNVAGTVAATILGGSGSDSLTATGTAAHQLNGGAGDDVLTANAGLSILTGGAGSDTFVIGVASTNVNSASTIADLSSGDVISFTGATSFSSAAVALDATTAVFQDYANAAIASVGANGLAWFVFQGNTYIVMDAATGAGDGTTFENGHDMIVKITGVKDLSTGSFNTDGLFEMV